MVPWCQSETLVYYQDSMGSDLSEIPIVSIVLVGVCSSIDQKWNRDVRSSPRAVVEAMPGLRVEMVVSEACQTAPETAYHSAGGQAIGRIAVVDRLRMLGVAVSAAGPGVAGSAVGQEPMLKLTLEGELVADS